MIGRKTFIKGTVATGLLTWLSGRNKLFILGKEGNELEDKVKDEYERRANELMQVIRSQLESQGKTSHIAVFENIIRAKIIAELEEQYGIPFARSQNSMTDTTYVLPEGGVIGYEGFGGTTVVDTYMDYDTTQAYLTGVNVSIKASTIISYILGALPAWGYAFSLLFALNTIANTVAVQSVNNAGGYGIIMSVSHPLEGTATVLLGWSQYPIAIVPYGSSNIHVEDFSNN